MYKVKGNTLKNEKGNIIYVTVCKDLAYSYMIPAGSGGITASIKARDYKLKQ